VPHFQLSVIYTKLIGDLKLELLRAAWDIWTLNDQCKLSVTGGNDSMQQH
jgi:hypothetical protein